MVTAEKFVTQRLFGRTAVDSLNLHQNAWYIDEEQVTVTAAQINAIASMIPTSQTVDVANDDILFLDHSGSHVAAYDSIPDLMALVCGTAATTGLSSTAGVISIAPSDNTITVANDSLVYMTQAGVPKKESVADFVNLISGNGIYNTAGRLATATNGKVAKGGVFFTNPGDCTSVTVGAATYTRGAGGAGTGEWLAGASADESSTNLTNAINNDTRNGGNAYFYALKSGAGVIIYGKGIGTTYNAAVARVGGAEPSTAQALVGGANSLPARMNLVTHTVTAFDCLLAGFDVMLPWVPTVFTVQVRDSAGVLKMSVTDQFTIQATPNRIHATFAGATHVIAGDTVTVFAQE